VAASMETCIVSAHIAVAPGRRLRCGDRRQLKSRRRQRATRLARTRSEKSQPTAAADHRVSRAPDPAFETDTQATQRTDFVDVETRWSPRSPAPKMIQALTIKLTRESKMARPPSAIVGMRFQPSACAASSLRSAV
jgi:hypothetical protein